MSSANTTIQRLGSLSILRDHEDTIYLALRILAGALLAFHGMQKVFGVLSPFQPPLFSQLGIGGILELVLGLALIVGVLVRYAAFLASGMMAVAYVQFHWKFDFGEAFFPAINKGELALVYAFVFLFIAAREANVEPAE